MLVEFMFRLQGDTSNLFIIKEIVCGPFYGASNIIKFIRNTALDCKTDFDVCIIIAFFYKPFDKNVKSF